MTLRSSKSPEVKVMRRKLSREMDVLSRGLDVMICYELDLAKEEIFARMAELEKEPLDSRQSAHERFKGEAR